MSTEPEKVNLGLSGRRGKLIEFLLTRSMARIVLALVGLGGLAAGALIAWRAQSATPLLIISSVFVALALVDWEEFTLTRGDITLRFLRRKLQEIAARDDVAPGAKRELLEVASEVADVALVESRRRSKARLRSALGEIVVGHIAEADRVVLSLGTSEPPPELENVRCTVVGPSSESWSTTAKIATRKGSGRDVWQEYIIIFPLDFADAPRGPIAKGEYEANWIVESETLPSRALALDRFVVPG
jgi:hypothetical protein